MDAKLKQYISYSMLHFHMLITLVSRPLQSVHGNRVPKVKSIEKAVPAKRPSSFEKVVPAKRHKSLVKSTPSEPQGIF